MTSYDPGPLMSPREHREIENLLVNYVYRRDHGIPMAKRLPPPESPLLKAVRVNAAKWRKGFAPVARQIEEMSAEARRLAVERQERERAVLAKAIADTREMLARNPERRSASWLAAMECKISAIEGGQKGPAGASGAS